MQSYSLKHMPKFYLASDLHLEFGSLVIENHDNVDCLILAGDVAEFAQFKKEGETKKPWIADVLRQISRDFKRVVWVPGNHEYYGCYYMQKSLDDTRDWLKAHYCDNIELLDNQSIGIEGVPIHCATLWTDMNRGDPVAQIAIRGGLNDYNCIRGATAANAGSKISTRSVLGLHAQSLKFLANATADGRDCVVVTHHQPTMAGLSYNSGTDIDYAYASDLSEFFIQRPNIQVWCSGHAHAAGRELVLGPHQQRFLTNCRGYLGYEPIAAKFAPMLFSV